MKLRYQVGDVPELRFATAAEACEVAAQLYSYIDGPPLMPIDRTTKRAVGSELFGLMLEKIHCAQREVMA